MLQRICDRCLKPIVYETDADDYLWIGRQIRSSRGGISGAKKYDLCPDCMRRIKRSLEPKTEEELEAEDLSERREFTLNFFNEDGLAMPMVITWSKADMDLLINSICSYINTQLIDRFHTADSVTFKEVYRYFVIEEKNDDKD